MAYIGTLPSNGVRKVHTYTATAGQTTFSGAGSENITLSYSDGTYVDVYQNGVLLGTADYTATSGTTVVLPLGGFGGLFEQIREGIDEATLISPEGSLEDSTAPDTSVNSKCAEVSAAWYLASELNVDQPDLTLVSLESKQWSDPNFGCVEGAIKSEDTTPGFLVNFLHQGETYSVRTNRYGSLLKIC